MVFRDELTLEVRREHLVAVAQALRDDAALRFELCLGVSGVHYPDDTGRELHAVYPLMSITHNRRIRVEVAAPDADPHIPSLFSVYPTTDWHERETYDFFGIIFDGHPSLTRIEMPDDWVGPPAAQGLPAGRHPGGVPRRRDPAARRAEGVQLMTDTSTPPETVDHGRRRRTGTRSSTAASDSAVAGERIVVNMGPQHPSTHGVLRLILEIEGETITEARCGIGYLHTGIEKNLEYRNWTQGVTFVTRMDYLSPFFNETAYCLGRGETARRHRRHPRARQRHPGDADGTQPDLQPPGRAGHRRHGTRRHVGDVLRLPRSAN